MCACVCIENVLVCTFKTPPCLPSRDRERKRDDARDDKDEERAKSEERGAKGRRTTEEEEKKRREGRDVDGSSVSSVEAIKEHPDSCVRGRRVGLANCAYVLEKCTKIVKFGDPLLFHNVRQDNLRSSSMCSCVAPLTDV